MSKSKSKKEVSQLEDGARHFLSLASGIMSVVREKAHPYAAIYRLTTEGGRVTLGKIVDLAYADWQAEQPRQPEMGEPPLGGSSYRNAPTNGNTLPANHYRVHVTYAPMPTFVDLNKEFGEGNVSFIFDKREWKLDSSCVGMDRTPGEKIFLVKDFGCRWESEEATAWGRDERSAVAPNGYRPATHEEVYEFQKAHPKFRYLVALGSFTLYYHIRHNAYLCNECNDDRRYLGFIIGDFALNARDCCLFVSK